MKRILFAGLLLINTHLCFADTRLSLKECEGLFLKNNFDLIAESLNIDIARARVQQARIWENPYLSAEINAINPSNPNPAGDGTNTKYFDAGRNGQKAVAIQQLIYLGGKKRNEIDLARTNTQLADLAFKDLLRNLKYQLRVSYFSIYYAQLSANALNKQAQNIDTLITAYKTQVQKGNTPLKDLVRLQSLYIGLKNSQVELQHKIIEEQKNLAMLTGTADNIIPAPAVEELLVYNRQLDIPLDQLQSSAMDNRPDLAYAEKNVMAAQQNLSLQRSLGRPDITLGGSYDQHGGAFNNQVNLTLGIPLRIWNSNKGNINAAGFAVQQTNAYRDKQRFELSQEVTAAYQKYYAVNAGYKTITTAIESDFTDVYNGIYYNFQRRNISMIEFTDFMESYNQSLIQLNDTRMALVEATEEINKVAGTDIINKTH